MKGWQVACGLGLLPVAVTVTEMHGSADQIDLRPWQALQDQCSDEMAQQKHIRSDDARLQGHQAVTSTKKNKHVGRVSTLTWWLSVPEVA